MRVVYAERARLDISAALQTAARDFPSAYDGLVRRFREIAVRIAIFPHSGMIVDGRPDIRAIPMIRYPYTIYYRVTQGELQIIQVRHAAQLPPARSAEEN